MPATRPATPPGGRAGRAPDAPATTPRRRAAHRHSPSRSSVVGQVVAQDPVPHGDDVAQREAGSTVQPRAGGRRHPKAVTLVTWSARQVQTSPTHSDSTRLDAPGRDRHRHLRRSVPKPGRQRRAPRKSGGHVGQDRFRGAHHQRSLAHQHRVLCEFTSNPYASGRSDEACAARLLAGQSGAPLVTNEEEGRCVMGCMSHVRTVAVGDRRPTARAAVLWTPNPRVVASVDSRVRSCGRFEHRERATTTHSTEWGGRRARGSAPRRSSCRRRRRCTGR